MNANIQFFTLPSGLKCYIMERKGFAEARAFLCVNFGALCRDFLCGGAAASVPRGTAHFLEHKMFDGETSDGLTFFDKFAVLSAEVNAFTSFNSTVYHFGAARENFFAALEVLLEMASRARFDERSVEAEKGIISQEILMFDDDPATRAYFGATNVLHGAAAGSILGDVGDITQISANDLKACHDAFYRPANMALFCAGNVAAAEVAECASGNFFQDTSFDATKKPLEKVSPPNCAKIAQTGLGAAVPAVCVGFGTSEQASATSDAAASVAADALFGSSSDFFDELFLKGTIDETFCSSVFSGANFVDAVLTGNAADFDFLFEKILSAAETAQKNGVDAKSFQRAKKKRQGQIMRVFDSFEAAGPLFADCFAKGFGLKELVNATENLTLEQTNAAMPLFAPKNAVLSVAT